MKKGKKKKLSKRNEIFCGEIETEGKWQRQNKHETNRFLRKKREMISRRENKEIHNRKKEKDMKKKRPNKKKFMTYEDKLSKRRRWRQNKSTDEEKPEVRHEEGSKTKMKQK